MVAQRMVAPGAEEFVASETPGPWLPPERTFAPLGGPGPGNAFSVERARYVDLLVEHEFDDALRHRRAPLLSERRQSAGHALRPQCARRAAVGRPLLRRQRRLARRGRLGAARQQHRGKRVRGSVDYSFTRARWLDRGDMADIAAWRPRRFATRPKICTTSRRRSRPRFPKPRRACSCSTRSTPDTPGPTRRNCAPASTPDSTCRSTRRCPSSSAARGGKCCSGFAICSAIPTIPASVYDELLVVRPPKRVVGGFLVRF